MIAFYVKSYSACVRRSVTSWSTRSGNARCRCRTCSSTRPSGFSFRTRSGRFACRSSATRASPFFASTGTSTPRTHAFAPCTPGSRPTRAPPSASLTSRIGSPGSPRFPRFGLWTEDVIHDGALVRIEMDRLGVCESMHRLADLVRFGAGDCSMHEMVQTDFTCVSDRTCHVEFSPDGSIRFRPGARQTHFGTDRLEVAGANCPNETLPPLPGPKIACIQPRRGGGFFSPDPEIDRLMRLHDRPRGHQSERCGTRRSTRRAISAKATGSGTARPAARSPPPSARTSPTTRS